MFGLARRSRIEDAKDPNLRLAILDNAWREKLLAPPAPPVQAGPRAREALLAIPLRPEVLEGLRTLEWGGGHPIQHLVIPDWDGEDGTFDVEDLTGIAACRNLERIALGAARVRDVSALRGLDALKVFELNFGGMNAAVFFPGRAPVPVEGAEVTRVEDLRPLLDLPSLRELRIGACYRATAANDAVLKKLQARGVHAPTLDDLQAAAQSAYLSRAREDSVRLGLEAWEQHRYADVVRHLAPYESGLEGTVLKKLQLARKKAAG